MKGLQVIRIDKKTATEFITKKHYSRRMSIFWAGFGLVENGLIVGVCVFGQPSPSINRYAFKNKNFRIYELSRLVIQTETENAASYLISKSLKNLEKPSAVISYSDMEYSHCGIVYQATNFVYTGETISHDHLYIVDGKKVHSMSLRDKGITSPKKWARENNIQTIKPKPKHRYFYFNGSKFQRKDMIRKLKYKIIEEYPKCDQRRYDAGPIIHLEAA